ncbi:TPA: two-component system response regulator [Patescibacteria group bacterium]|nr:two-component system response regulator [Patescibacteria group bacterium]
MDNQKTVLIVEDNETLQGSYSEALESAGYSTLGALDGYHGLDLMVNNLGKISLLLLDLMMPGVDGLEVLRTVKENEEKYGSVPIVILTNMTSENVIKEAFSLGATSYLVKTDLDYEGLIKEVDKFLG